jgi:hypothetical protein
METQLRFPPNSSTALPALFLAVLLMLIATACGGGGSSSAPASNPGGGNPPPASSSAVQVKVGDAPADRVVSFEVTAGPITMTPASGAAVTVMSTARRIELTHLSGTSEPLALLLLSRNRRKGFHYLL